MHLLTTACTNIYSQTFLKPYVFLVSTLALRLGVSKVPKRAKY